MENENKIVTDVEEVLSNIMDEINDDVAEDEAAEVVAEEVVEETADEAVEDAADEETEEEEYDEEYEEEYEEEEYDDGPLFEEVVSITKVEPYGAATSSVVFGALGTALPFLAMALWLMEFRLFAVGTVIAAFAFGLTSLITCLKAIKYRATVSGEMAKAGRTFSIIALAFSVVSGGYMAMTVIKELLITALILLVVIVGIIVTIIAGPSWINLFIEFMESQGYTLMI